MPNKTIQTLFDFVDHDRAQANPTRWQAAKQQSPPAFSGKTYEREFDEDRLRGQQARIWLCMKDGRWRTLSEISIAAHPAPEASVSAQLRKFGAPKHKGGWGLQLNKRRRGDPKRGWWEYQLLKK